MNPKILTRVKKGDSFLTAWRQIVAEVNKASPKLLANPTLRKRLTPNGTIIKQLDYDTWDHPFKVSASDDLVRVSPGTVNGIMPYIKSPDGYVRLNGLDESGRFNFDSGSFPAMVLDKGKKNDDNGIYVMVKVKRNKSTGGFGTKADESGNITTILPEDLEIVLEKEFEGPTAAGKDNDFGYHPLGYIQFDSAGEAVTLVSQVCHFNLKYDFQDRRATPAEIAKDPDQLTIGRHIFYPV